MIEFTADKLKSTNIKTKFLRDELKKILKMINEKIIETHKQGNETFVMKLPIHFPSIPLNNDLSRIYIYSNCITELLNNGYNVKIVEKENVTLLCISWSEKNKKKKWDKMRSIIDEHRK